ncbi:MAG: endonuclease/exonuclease/phosphatase family protein [Polyangiaceae bacterium]
MTTFLFWNMNARRELSSLTRLVAKHDVDIAMLAECNLDMVDVLRSLNSASGGEYHYNKGNCEKITIYSRFSRGEIKPVLEDHRMTIRRLRPATGGDLLLAVVHLRSKLHQTSSSQTLAATEIARSVATAEKKAGHARTVLVGDLNMHPFEDGVVGASGLHAVMDRKIAAKRQRTVEGREHAFFYNPMWSMLGDASQGPPGTYYEWRSEQIAYFWHMFDQVLLRPDLLASFDNADLQILTSDGNSSLLTAAGTPDLTTTSDHLPLLFKLRS